jgi:hypothetical protein
MEPSRFYRLAAGAQPPGGDSWNAALRLFIFTRAPGGLRQESGASMNEEPLREWIREKLREGTLPRTQSDRIWGGPGSGRLCAACNQPIAPTTAEIEDHDESGRPLVYHARCHSLLNLERDSLPPP